MLRTSRKLEFQILNSYLSKKMNTIKGKLTRPLCVLLAIPFKFEWLSLRTVSMAMSPCSESAGSTLAQHLKCNNTGLVTHGFIFWAHPHMLSNASKKKLKWFSAIQVKRCGSWISESLQTEEMKTITKDHRLAFVFNSH